VPLWNENSITCLEYRTYCLSQKGPKSKKTILKDVRERRPTKAFCDESVD